VNFSSWKPVLADPTDITTPMAASSARLPRGSRRAAALAAAVVLFALVASGSLALIFAVPVAGLVLALGAPADHTAQARPLAGRRRNAVLGALLLVSCAVVVLQPQLSLPLYGMLGLELTGLVVALLAVLVLALPLTMAESPVRVDELGVTRLVATRRNLILSSTVLLTVTVWYTGLGLSYLPIAALVVGLPVLLAITRWVAARRGRLEYGLWRRPLRGRLGPHRLQLVNVLVLCVLLALTLRTGAYDATALGISARAQRVLSATLLAGLAALVLLALVPLKRIRLGSVLLVAAGSVFAAGQLVMVYRPAAEPVTIASPLADEWYVGQGGHAELVNYHRVGSTQSNALDIMQVVDGRTHRPGSTDLTGYYIYDEPVLAPADGVVTAVLDGRPDLPIGSADSHYQTGNHVVIDIGGGRYLMMGHLRQGSILVTIGDRVRVGQPIARVGNSGNTSEPHIHIQAQTLGIGIGDVQALDRADIVRLSRTLHTYPLVFRDVVLTRHAAESQPAAADPRRGDLVRPVGPAHPK
jgi:hypothetical protein